MPAFTSDTSLSVSIGSKTQYIKENKKKLNYRKKKREMELQSRYLNLWYMKRRQRIMN